MESKTLDNIAKKLNIKEVFFFFFLLFIYALSYNIFLVPLGIVAGGTSGIGLIFNKLFNAPGALVMVACNIIVLVISYFTIGKRETFSGLATSLLLPFFMHITRNVNFDISQIDPLINVVIVGLIHGWAQGHLEKLNVGQGGIMQLSKVAQDRFNYSLTKANFNMNVLVILGGFFAFGLNSLILAIILLYVQSIITDKVALGISTKKAFYIITNEDDKVIDFIRNEMKRGASIISIKGGFNKEKDEIIFTVIPTRDYYVLKNGILDIDKDAFIVVTDSYEVTGGV